MGGQRCPPRRPEQDLALISLFFVRCPPLSPEQNVLLWLQGRATGTADPPEARAGRPALAAGGGNGLPQAVAACGSGGGYDSTSCDSLRATGPEICLEATRNLCILLKLSSAGRLASFWQAGCSHPTTRFSARLQQPCSGPQWPPNAGASAAPPQSQKRPRPTTSLTGLMPVRPSRPRTTRTPLLSTVPWTSCATECQVERAKRANVCIIILYDVHVLSRTESSTHGCRLSQLARRRATACRQNCTIAKIKMSILCQAPLERCRLACTPAA